MNKPRRPALRWHGGKWKLADWIIGHFPKHRVYVEPFGGAASVLIKKTRSYAEVYNDLDGEVVNFFRMLRDCGPELCRLVDLSPFSREEFQLSYQPSDDPIEQARRTVMRTFMGFGTDAHNKVSGFRANSNRPGTTPAHDWANYPKSMTALIERFSGVVIENRDALKVMYAHDTTETLHYVDPPYVHVTRGGHAKYRHEMDDDQHVELAEFLMKLEGDVVLSGYRCDLYDDLYSSWTRIDRKTHADGARDRVESLYLSGLQIQSQLFG